MATGIKTPHPYFPRDLVLDHYVPNTNTVFQTLVYVGIGFLSVAALVLALGYSRRNTTLQRNKDKFAFFWFILSGMLNIFFEAYYEYNHATLAGDNHPVAQVWKEYALSDSRYLSSDSFVRVVETITTLVWGPLSMYCAWSVYHNSPSRHIVQLMLSVGQLYSCTLYYATSIFEGSPHCDPDPYYYYIYFWSFNAPWLMTPLVLLNDSVRFLLKAVVVAEVQQKNKAKKIQ
ncbi:MAG: Emopamil binding protein-domain-containing protein [Linnemannia gamsii]|nr:MAG: Emopamil binding protein-domain-containing protein [Linnemannia gamsii]